MTSYPMLPTGPFEHAAMDYARLREQGLQLLGRLAGAQWSDFNAHDPGITILEQLCYAITDLGYRIDHPMADLLAGDELELPGPAALLTSDPVTATDLRKLALDVEGVDHAWVEPRAEPELAFHYHPGDGKPGNGELRLRPEPGEIDATPVRLRGLDRVLLVSRVEALELVAGRLHRSRALATDFELVVVGQFPVVVEAEIEVEPLDDPTAVLAEIIEQIELCLAPQVRFTSLADAMAEGHRVDAIFEGPMLERGFVTGPLPKPRRTIYVSDLIHAITEVGAVRTVRSLALRNADGKLEPWALDLGEGPQIATLATTESKLTLQRAGRAIAVDPKQVGALLARRELTRTQARTTGESASKLGPAPGRDRKLASHRSIQYQLPAAYGVGPLGLPSSASARRRAQARQLEAFLLLFDQLLANAFAQLAHARELLSPGSRSIPTYVANPVEDPRLRIDELLVHGPEAYRAWLAANVSPGGADSVEEAERRGRFLNHLLARFGEQLGEHVPLDDRLALLRDYPRLSGARGSGMDIFGVDERSALEQRVRLELGSSDDQRFFLVEHVLLRPLPEDAPPIRDDEDPSVPLLAGVAGPDPWSLQVSYVFEDRGSNSEAFVAQVLIDETPAHLIVHLHWVADWASFAAAWAGFRSAYQSYRRAKLYSTTVEDEVQIRVRDARDRVIDLLGIGRSFPIRDLPLPKKPITVAPGKRATIPLVLSQDGVIYELRDRASGKAIEDEHGPIAVTGTGGPIELVTPAILKDQSSYRVLAVKLHGGVRHEAWLYGAVSVAKGVDTSVIARIRLTDEVELLDSSIQAPRPGDARIVDWGAQVEVEIEASQEGVVYELLDEADRVTVLSVETEVGTGGLIVLRTTVIEEDVDLRVRASRQLADLNNPELGRGLLDVILPLRVRANPAAVPELATAVVVDHGNTKATLRVAETQKSASYRVWRRRVRDPEFVFEDTNKPTIDLDVEGRTIRVLHPTGSLRWPESTDLQALGDAQTGTGGDLEFALGEQIEDTLLVVQAIKLHHRDPLKVEVTALNPKIASAVRLARANVQLVRPDSDPPIRLRVEVDGAATRGLVLVEGGQSGVFYQLNPKGLEPLAELGYFHQRDQLDAKLNKGIDQLRVGVDLAIARTASTSVDVTSLTTVLPLPPLLDSLPLPVGTVIQFRARRAMTGLEEDLIRSATIGSVAKVAAKPASVVAGEAAQIVITDSVVGERYRLLRGDQVIAEAEGTGADLALDTLPITEPTVLVVAMIASEPDAIVVERRVAVTIELS